MSQLATFTPYKAYSDIRSSQRRITVKSKSDSLNSLVTMGCEEIQLNFFNKGNDYIFFEFPKFEIAIFYFFRKKFSTRVEAFEAAMPIMSEVFEN